jgi:regulator of sigma E protease
MAILIGAYVVLVVALLFGLSIFVHEFGHYLAARLCGLVVETFSIGFGPALWKRKVNGITYKIGCIPVGGYVSLPQLDPSGMKTIQGAPDSEGEPSVKLAETATDASASGSLPAVAPWKKIVVSLAGAAGNILFAGLLAWIVFAFRGTLPLNENSTQIGDVLTTSPAYAQGLRPGDTILAVNGSRVTTWQEIMQMAALHDQVTFRVRPPDGGAERELTLTPVPDPVFGIPTLVGVEAGRVCQVNQVVEGSTADLAGIRPGDIIRTFDGSRIATGNQLIERVQAAEGRAAEITLLRDRELIELTVTPIRDEAVGIIRIGIVFDQRSADLMIETLTLTPFAQLKYDATAIVRILKALVTPRQAGKAARGMGGFVSIFAAFWIYTQAGILIALGFTRFLNVNLAILNLMPIPVLDGGHVVFSIWEWVTGRPIHEKVIGWLVNIFATLLILAMVLLTWQDISRWGRIHREVKAARATAAMETNAPAGEAGTNAAP